MEILSAPAGKWIKPMAQAGLIAKGIVYCLIGLLLVITVFSGSSATEQADKGGIFTWIHEQSAGKILLGIIAIGLACYAGWRIIMAVKDTERKGTDLKGLAQRGVYLFSGLVYLSLAYTSIRLLLHNRQSNGDSRQQLAGELLAKPFGVWLAALAAIAMMVTGFFQIYRATLGKYKKYVERDRFNSTRSRSFLVKSGKVGYIARGIVWLIVGWLFLKAAITANAKKAGNTGDAFQWLQSSIYGDLLLAAVALGLVCYGIFMFVRARYQPIHAA